MCELISFPCVLIADLSQFCPSLGHTPAPAKLCRVHHVQGSHYSLGQSKAVVTLCQLR